MVVPGSQAIKRAAEEEGLDRIFTEADSSGAIGVLHVLRMNPDTLQR